TADQPEMVDEILVCNPLRHRRVSAVCSVDADLLPDIAIVHAGELLVHPAPTLVDRLEHSSSPTAPGASICILPAAFNGCIRNRTPIWVGRINQLMKTAVARPCPKGKSMNCSTHIPTQGSLCCRSKATPGDPRGH